MADFDIDECGDLIVGSNADFSVATGDDFIRQRFIRRLTSNPNQYDAEGNIVVVSDDKFAPDWGIGLGQDVDSVNTSESKLHRYNKIQAAMRQEPGIDMSKSWSISFTDDTKRQNQYIRIEFTTVNGSTLAVGLQV